MVTNSVFLGESFPFLETLERASRAATLNRPVLVVGERGTGKELVAERLHRLSPRWREPLLVLNCAALPETLIEAELFGHEAGAFTGASRARAGRFEEADGGTLFLDELATLSPGAQERLLRAVEYGEVTRIGASRALRVDVRIVAATNEDLPTLVSEGRFRADLLDRLSFEVITLPPLRARSGDIQLLAEHFGRRMATEAGWDGWPGFSPAACDALARYDWPGNVRELRNVVERAVYRWDEPEQAIVDVVFDPFASAWQPQAGVKKSSAGAFVADPDAVADKPASIADLRTSVAAYERRLISEALTRHHWNQRRTAADLGLTYDQLRHAMKGHALLRQ